MEIKTKFDIGQTVWYVDYKKDFRTFSPTAKEVAVPCGIAHGEVTAVQVIIVKDQASVSERYKVSDTDGFLARINADEVYATQAEAEQAWHIAEHKYHVDKKDELLAVKALLDELTERAEENGIIPKQEKDEEQVFFQEETQCPYCGENFHYTYVKGEPYQVVCPKCEKLVKAVSIIKFR